MRSPWARVSPSSVRSTRKPWTKPSVWRTGTCPSAAWHGKRNTVHINTKRSVFEQSFITQSVSLGRHALLRTFVPVFRAAGGFLRAAPAGFVVLGATVFLALDMGGFFALPTAGLLALAAAGLLTFATAGFLALTAASIGTGNSSLADFRVRWWPWCRDWMRAASSSVRSRVSSRLRRSSSRY